MNFLKKLFFNKEQKVSWTKIGAQLFSISGTIVTLPDGMVPAEIKVVAGVTIWLGVVLGISGARDAMDKAGMLKK